MNTTAPEAATPPTRPPTPVLLLLYGPGHQPKAPQRFTVAPGTQAVLGREGGKDTRSLALPEDRWLSRRHARLTAAATGWPITVQDLGSTHGTFVNGAPALGTITLCDGDLLRVGHSLLLLRRDPSRKGSAPSGVLGKLGGPSSAMAVVRDRLAQLGASPAPVLLLGESGTGKELAAQALHDLASPTRSGKLVAINCAALTRERADAELFGTRVGGFTGARDLPGRLQAAEHGTLFLDEVGDMAKEVQTLLLRVLQDREVTPVGGTAGRIADVRFIAATNRDLSEALASGAFRLDLYHRLSTHTVFLPPLRERREDVLSLLCELWGAEPPGLTTPLAEALVLYRWPGNVRELRNLAADLQSLREGDEPLDLTPALATRLQRELPTAAPSERPHLEGLLHTKTTISEMARTLGVDRRTVRRRLKKHGLRDP